MTWASGKRGRIAIAAAIAVATAAAIALIADDDRANGGSAPEAEAAAAGRWSSLARSPLARTEVGAARIDNHIYVVGGFAPPGGETSEQAVRYDIDGNAWSSVAPMPIGVNHPAVAALGGRLYVHGGYRDDASLTGETDALQSYDPASGTWTTLAPSGSPRAAHVLVPVGGRLYAIGGAFRGKALTMVQIYDTATGAWSSAPGMKVPREHIAAAAVGKKILVLGGRDEGKNLSTVERFSTRPAVARPAAAADRAQRLRRRHRGRPRGRPRRRAALRGHEDDRLGRALRPEEEALARAGADDHPAPRARGRGTRAPGLRARGRANPGSPIRTLLEALRVPKAKATGRKPASSASRPAAAACSAAGDAALGAGREPHPPRALVVRLVLLEQVVVGVRCITNSKQPESPLTLIQFWW